jgi:hypothetical protein
MAIIEETITSGGEMGAWRFVAVYLCAYMYKISLHHD